MQKSVILSKLKSINAQNVGNILSIKKCLLASTPMTFLRFVLNAENLGMKNNLITLEQYQKRTPFEQGFASYMQADITGSKIPKKNPYDRTKEKHRASNWDDGAFRAMIICQDEDDS